MLLRWDPGVGKTRGALQFALMWMRHSSHKRAVLLADSDIILRAIQEEVIKYNNYDVELEARTFKQGKKGHGKLIAKTNYIKKQGFEKSTLTSFMNDVRKESENWADAVAIMRRRYANYVFIIDEVHNLRRTDTEKQRYNDMIALVDAMRDICPFIFLTATPVVDNWKDAFSPIALMYPPDVREEIYSQVDRIPKYPESSDQIAAMKDLLAHYAYGMLSDRKSEGVVPNEVPIPTPFTVREGNTIRYTIEDENTPTLIQENLYPVFMSQYQTAITSANEERNSSAMTQDTEALFSVKNDFYSKLRQQYDFVPPIIDGKVANVQELIIEENGRFRPSTEASIVDESGEIENIFEVYWDEDALTGQTIYRTDIGLGKYSAKYAELLRLLTYEPALQDKAGYVHTLWVEQGIKPLSAAFFAAGWEQFTGNDHISSAGTKPRFAVIHGGSTPTQIARIIEAFNSEANRDGSILRVVIGSRKSGISISFTNALFFIELSPDFNNTTRIQAKGRVFRADSLLWLPRELRNIYTASLLALPYGMDTIADFAQDNILKNETYTLELIDPDTNETEILNVNPATTEVRMYHISEIKSFMGKQMMDVLEKSSIESILRSSMSSEPNDVDTRTHALLYSLFMRNEAKARILNAIPAQWAYPLTPSNMYEMRATADMISSHTYALTKYGMPRPVNSFSNVVSAYSSSDSTSQAFSLTYDRNFFLVDQDSSYNPQAVRDVLTLISNAPTTEYAFYNYISRENLNDMKTLLLEMSLGVQPGLIPAVDRIRFDRIRPFILRLYENFWQTFGGGRLVHILWYGIKHNSHLSKLGINSTPRLTTRMLLYNTNSNSTENRWQYISSADKEVLYLSQMARNIQTKEEEAIRNAASIGYYVHYSIYDGGLRLREISDGDLRKSKSFDVSLDPATLDILSSILSRTPADITSRYRDNIPLLQEDVFFAAQRKSLLIIR